MGGSPLKIAALAVLAIVLIALPQVVKSSFAIDIFIRILLFSFIGVAWNLMGGYAKQLSLGHAAYFGLGAYTSTILQIDFGISPWIGMIAGGGVAMLASLMMGVAESLGVQYVGADSGLIVVFAMLLFTLAFKPTGLGGGRAR